MFEEFALLCEAWSRAARREPSAAFAFNGRSAKAVNNKLTWLKSILPSEIIDLPSCDPELLGDTLARCKLLASKQGRSQLIGDFDATTWEGASEADLASESVQSQFNPTCATNANTDIRPIAIVQFIYVMSRGLL